MVLNSCFYPLEKNLSLIGRRSRLKKKEKQLKLNDLGWSLFEDIPLNWRMHCLNVSVQGCLFESVFLNC